MDNIQVISQLRSINRQLRNEENGLYFASLGEHYRKYCWWRDIYYQVAPNLTYNKALYAQTYQTFLNYLLKYELKIDNLTLFPDSYDCNTCLHPRVYPDLTQIDAPWGNMQMDAIMLMLFGLCQGLEKDIDIIRNDKDWNIIQKVIWMYESLEYWKLSGNDAWEEPDEIHSHAIGSALSALIKLRDLGFKVNEDKLFWCKCELDNLLPKESITKDCDLAQLQLIYPLNIVTEEQRDQILNNIESKLLRQYGVARYAGDVYYNIASRQTLNDYNGLFFQQWEGWYNQNEMQWTFGLAYLSIIYSKIGNKEKAQYYLDKILEPLGNDLMIPEGYYALTKIKNDNTPLGWANALTIIALELL